ncbi:uncharacterized protein LOC135472269 [Liolophura sinensis]|uniref:uncharacterized protein LOC135472269 n=1 Tax=Liolophura sinensis TaxID=3198878 RepID=UPI003158926E
MAFTIFILACLAGGSTAVLSVDLRPYNITAGYMFVINDKNEDAILSLAEFEAPFNVYDFNGDKKIERHEYVCMIRASNENLVHVSHAIYDYYDLDHDSKLEKHDFAAFYKKMDKDENGEVSYHEFVVYWTQLLKDTEHHSLHGNPHPLHEDKYCEKHGHNKGR